MKEYIKIGLKFYNRYLIGELKVISFNEESITVSTKNRGDLIYKYREIGKSLFFKEEHTSKKFTNTTEYFLFINEENRRGANKEK